MIRKRTLLLLPALLVLALAGCSGEVADEGRYSLTVVTQNDHAFADDQVSVGPLVVAGGRVTLDEGSEHRGTVLALAGEVRIDGRLDGDLLALGADVTLGGAAEVTGDVAHAGGTLDSEPGSTVRGQVTEESVGDLVGGQAQGVSVGGWFVVLAVLVVGMGGVAWVVVRVAARTTARVAGAAGSHPLVSGALGVLIGVIAPLLTISMVFTLFLIPLALVVLGLLGIVVALGLVAVGEVLGARVAASQGRSPSRPTAAMLGTAGLVGVLHVLALVPVLGLVVIAAVAAVAVGAVFITGFGTRPYAPPDLTSAVGTGATGRPAA